MRFAVASQCVLVALATLAVLPGLTMAAESDSLGGYPVCEASAAQAIPCPTRPGQRCLLIGDNEIRDALYVYPLNSSGIPEIDRRNRISLAEPLSSVDDGELSDIEAFARLASGELLVYGSHSRNRICERKKKRRRYLGLSLGHGQPRAGSVGLVRTKGKADLADSIDADAAGLLAEVAQRIRRVESAADANRCGDAFEIEGAMVVRSEEEEQVWVGLRHPLLDSRAILLRHDIRAGALRFDAARLVDLDGEGVRGLAVERDWVYGLSRRADGAGERAHRLWRFPLSALAADTSITQMGTSKPAHPVIEVEEVAEVPSFSEGLAFSEAGIIVVWDGRLEGDRCEQEAGFVVVPWPDR
jgi:hypothetical protein